MEYGPIRLLRTAFVIYNHVDIKAARTFLLDFGLSIAEETENGIFLKGYGIEPFIYLLREASDASSSFGGAAYVTESYSELERASKFPTATKISPLRAPGGGYIVTLYDPSGFPVHLVCNQELKSEEPQGLQQLTVNYEDVKPRKGTFQRFSKGPAPVYRWGHYGVTYSSDVGYNKMFEWYTKVIGLAPSDVVQKEGQPITCFFHIDRRKEYTDHHCFFFKPAKAGEEPHVAHAAFEVHDFDVQQLGHNYLESRGYSLCWGVGRHVLGSQVFDYWFDPSGFMVEHYADGDLVNEDTEVATVKAGPQALSVWGPPVPDVF